MLVYILKSAACLAILFVFYKLFLEKESIHKFKRLYLLGALVFSLIVPALVFTEYVEVEPPAEVTYAVPQTAPVSNEIIHVPPALEADVLDIEPILWGVYFIGLFFFGLKFIRNLFQIFRRIRRNPKHKLNRFTQVLLLEKITPHTFFSYIFLNKVKFESKQIPKEVLLHEETHAQQKHSWDVVFVELLQVIFWINPFIYLAKKAIKLNHEFLADQAVLQKNIDATTYKNTLLSYLSPDSEKKYQPLANAINYSSIKKRFTIMKTQTSKKAILLRSLLLLPLLALMLYGFSETKIETIIADSSIETNFENKHKTGVISNRSVELAGLILDAESFKPLKGVEIYDDKGNQLSKTDERGYYKVQFDDLGEGEIRFEYTLNKKGYKPARHSEHWGNLQGKIGKTFYFGLSKKESNTPEFSQHVSGNNLSYESVQNNLHLVQKQFEFDKKLNSAKKGNQDVLIEIDNVPYLVNNTGWIKINSKDVLISIDDNLIVPASEVNGILERKEITGMTPLEKNKTAPFAIYTSKGSTPNLDENPSQEQIIIGEDIQIFINKKGQLLVQDDLVALEDLLSYLSKINSHLSLEQKRKVVRSTIYVDAKSPKLVIEEVNDILTEYGSSTIDIINNSQEKIIGEILININKKGQILVQDNLVSLEDLRENLTKINPHLTQEEREKIEYSTIYVEEGAPKDVINSVNSILTEYRITRVNVLGPKGSVLFDGVPKDKATPKQIKDYNTLAKKYNTMLAESKSIQIKKQDVDRLEYIYSLMSDKQKADAEPFPDFPEPPLPPKAPRVIKGEASNIPQPPAPSKTKEIRQVEKELQEIEEEIQRVKYIKGEVDTDIPEPPAPPEPTSPLDHVISMAKKNAVFYLEGKEITSDKAIEVMKKNKDINIDSRSSNGKRPVVKMSKKPIKIGHINEPLNDKNSSKSLATLNGNYEKLKDSVRYSFQKEDPERPMEMYAKQIIDNNNQEAIFYHKGKKISFYKALDIVYSKRSISLATIKPNNGNKPIVILDRNFQKYDFKELMNSK